MEIVQHGVTGWLVPTGDVTALAQTMKAALAEAPSMRAACRQAAEERFGADRYAAEVAAVLKRA
jgi:glycosyltransferase involved in cell wall biosynthesis